MKLLLKLAALAPMVALGALGSHIRKDLVQIKNDAIVVVEASTSIDSSSGQIAWLSTSPQGPAIGTRGIVYTLPRLHNCQPVKRSAKYLAEAYIRIALVSDDGECPVTAKLTQAQYDGAVGALVYNNTLNALDMNAALHQQLGRHVASIPVIAVDSDYGTTLHLEAASLQDEKWSSNGFRAIFATMYPDDDSERLSVWEITLIALVVLLALGFCTSLFFHVAPNRHRTNANGGGLGTKQIETLPSCALDRLVLRTVTETDVQYLAACTTPLDVILRPGSMRKSVHSGTNNACGACEKYRDSSLPEDTRSTLGPCTCEDSKESILKGSIATCIVCIDDFVVGSQMRILPCGHNFHIECIDPWLTSKSSMCPLCKFDTRSVLTDLERTCTGTQLAFGDTDFDQSSSEPSSYLAESMPQLQRTISRFARKITAPVRALTRRVARVRRRTGTVGENIALDSSPMMQRDLEFGNAVYEYHDLTINTTIPITYSMSIGEDDMPGMVEQSQPTARPEKSHESAWNKKDDTNKDCDFDTHISRLSLTDNIPSESGLALFFK
ncbi:hypothetical protein GGF48_002429 [Coemansia sp. RSA 921]|nr:hypothetical protein GGF48_002429 [Coemansia sp. RSA 921]